MITRIITRSLFARQSQLQLILGQPFSSSPKVVSENEPVVAELPTVSFPGRAKHDHEERFKKDKLYEMTGYQRKNRPPRCRYYALEHKNRIYHVYNAYYYPMGRMMGQIATAIRGKKSPLYRNNEANIRNGDMCIIVNAEDPLFTGRKLLYKKLRYHTGFIGHLRTFSYKRVLNEKPELLYYYLLRKFMPKNKISGKYLENVKIYRGPTHDIPHLPQFAPDKNIYEYLPESNLDEFIKMSPDIKVVQESYPGLAKETHGRDFEYYQPQQTEDPNADDPNTLYEQPKILEQKVLQSQKQIEKMRRKEKKYIYRHTPARAPMKRKPEQELGYMYMRDERKAKNMKEYAEFADEDMEEEDEEVIEDPFGTKIREETINKIKEAQKSKNKK